MKFSKMNNYLSYLLLIMNSLKKETIQYIQLLKNNKLNLNKLTDNNNYMNIYYNLKSIYNNIDKNILLSNIIIKKVNVKPEYYLTDNDYTSDKIKNYIINNLHFCHNIVYENNSLFYFTKNGILNKKLIFHMLSLLDILKKLFNRSDKSQKIIYFETHKKKKFPRTKKYLGPNEINTGLTIINFNKNGNIILYRREEVLKVLIHELIHSNLIDEKLIFSPKNNYIDKFICVNNSIVINEAFTENFASLLNLFYIHIFLKLPISKLNTMFNNEVKYSNFISNKLLEYYNIENIDQIIKNNNKCKNIFNQKTNVFSYYILKNIILNNHIIFSKIWEKNSNFYKITNDLFINDLIDLLVNNFNSIHLFNKNIKNNNINVINNSLRLCLYELK